jgi:SAM-dependent methyltransferase
VKPSEYDKLDRIEDRMWWFAAMHANLLAAAQRSAIDRFHLPILDAGCGTGGFLSRLAAKYRERAVIGLDLDVRACTRAAIKSARPVCAGSINDLPFANNALAAIFSADVLCHDGVILNLPAYRWMLSRHDAAVSNVRRYTATGLRRLLKVVGFRPVYISYWNALLLPLMVVARKLVPRDRGVASDVKLYPPSVEMLCRAATTLEAAILRRGVRLPFGGSILAIAVKGGGDRD